MSRIGTKFYLCIWLVLCSAGLAVGLGRIGWAAALLGLTAVMLVCFCLFAEKLDRLVPDEDGLQFSPSRRSLGGTGPARTQTRHAAVTGPSSALPEEAPFPSEEATGVGIRAGGQRSRRFCGRPSDHLDVQAAQALTDPQGGATHGPVEAEESAGDAQEAA